MRLEQLASDLGDLLCVTVMALVVGLWCLRQLNRAAAAVFALTYLAALIVTTGLKMISADTGRPPDEISTFQFSSGAPSGHAAMSMVVYGSAAYLFSRAARGWEAVLGQAVCVLAIAGIAVTRVTLHTHTIADVLAGLIVGALVIALPISQMWSLPHIRGGSARWLLAAMILAAAVMLASGVRMPGGDFNLA